MAQGEDDDRGLRKGRFAPYGLLSPGMLWLILFFLVPLVTLTRIALSTQENRFTQDFQFTWEWSNFTDVIDQFDSIFLRSFRYAGIATLLCILIGYPMAYVIAFRGGRYRNLLLGLVVVPFFTSYLIRTIAWTSIMGDNGPFLGLVDALNAGGLLDAVGFTDNGRLLQTQWAVIGGLTYNFLPFMVLPIYVSLEKIDPRLIEAAKDLYSSAPRAFRKITLRLSLPGIFAGTLLTFIPATGDFVNAEFLGGPNNRMIGNIVQSQFLELNNYTSAAAISIILMAIITVGVLVYARLLGTDELAV
ncbi:MAG TPA: ABC transporter permease [Acidimicrobiia bacterium]|nr:ABC transporter permease [Acidimicrobiia bacterium]